MKILNILLVPFLITACGGSEVTPQVNHKTYQFSMQLEKMNLCGQLSVYNNYEIIAYDNDTSIISRHKANDNGEIEASFDQSHINLMIVRDTGNNLTDKKNLLVTVLAKYPVGNIGSFTVRTDDTLGCECETATIEVQPGNLTTEKINLPYGATSSNSADIQFSQTKLCEIENVGEALLVLNHLDNDNGDIYYQAIPETSQLTNNGELIVDIMLTGQVGRNIAVVTDEYVYQEIHYVTDTIYNYAVPGKSMDSIYVLDHERVKKTEFHASKQLGVIGTNEPVGFWGVHVPVTDDTTVITYNKPDFEPEELNTLLENPTATYDLDGSHYRVISGYKEFLRPDGTIDKWQYILPSSNTEGHAFVLPTDYLAELEDGIQYQDLVRYLFWDLNEIPALNSLDELYNSKWLNVFFQPMNEAQVRLETPAIRPPNTYSYVSLVSGF